MSTEPSSGKRHILRIIAAVLAPITIVAIIAAILFYPAYKKVQKIDEQTTNFAPQGLYHQQGDLKQIVLEKLRTGTKFEKIDAIMMANLLGKDAASMQTLALRDPDEDVRLSAAIQLFVQKDYSGGDVLSSSCLSNRRETLAMLAAFVTKYFPVEYHFSVDDSLERRKTVSEKMTQWFSSQITKK